jgi:tetratricopeptide (TPR) repeat protein
VDLFNEELGLRIELRKIANDGTPDKGPNTVSVRELSIPRKARDHMDKGLALLYGKSDYQGSLKPFQDAIQAYPDYYEAYAQMGVAYMKLADTANSEKAFQRSAQVSHERYQDAYLGLAELSLDGQRFADAETFARKAVDIDSNSWRANSQLARALTQLHRASEAEPSAAAAVKLKPDNPTLYLVLANIHMQLQDDRAQLDDLNQYLKLAPQGSFAAQARQQRDQLQQFLSASPSSPATPLPAPKTVSP